MPLRLFMTGSCSFIQIGYKMRCETGTRLNSWRSPRYEDPCLGCVCEFKSMKILNLKFSSFRRLDISSPAYQNTGHIIVRRHSFTNDSLCSFNNKVFAVPTFAIFPNDLALIYRFLGNRKLEASAG